MIRIERGKEIKPGVFEYRAEDHARGIKIEGRSRQPLLDGCRQIKSILKDTRGVRAAVFNRFARDGKNTQADVSCMVDWGADHTIIERAEVGLVVEKYRSFDSRRGNLDKRAL